ncbi:hypothetical protein GYA37_01390 [candidate division WWE3 bacterium]|uniref:Uncharacterized protein n=1 Tax=candidate division WWE3 bacterium TaxID=2053526 RepID=A0A7X9E6M7_UNCKA|nr:hypothetical protein [candidate division WWE3 bacterium]
MKKYLSKKESNIYKIKTVSFLVLIGIYFSSLNVSAQSKLEYYQKLFAKDFGFVVCKEDENNENKEDPQMSSSCSSNSYSILLTSSISRQELLKKYLVESKKLIVICDEPYFSNSSSEFTCDKSVSYSKDLDAFNGCLKKNGIQGVDLYVIPENILVSPNERHTLSEYFKAFKRSDMAPVVSEDTKVTVEVMRKVDQIKALLKTTTFEMFIDAILVLAMVSVCFGLLRYIVNNDRKKFSSRALERMLLKVRKTLINYRWFIAYEVFVLTLMYIPIVVVLGVKDGRGVNVGYFITYSLDTLKIANLIEYVNQNNYFRILVFFYNFAFLIALITLVAPSFMDILITASLKIKNARIKSNVLKYTIPSVLLLTIVVSSFCNIHDCYRFLILAIVILVFTVIGSFKYKTFSCNYSSSDRLLFLGVAVLVVFASFLVKVWERKIGPEYKEEGLISVGDSIVTLPYSKQIGENTIFKEFFISTPEPVFVDRYLVYFPNRSSVENKNALEFKDSGSFFIQNGALEDMTYAIYVNDELSRTLVSRVPTNFFRVKNFRTGLNQGDANIQITFSCEREDIGINEIKSDFYHLSSSNEIEKMESTLLYFPGCSEVGKPETFTVEFNPPYIDSEYFFMRLVNVSGKDIKDVRIISLDTVITPTYYSKGKGYSVISSGGLTDSSKTKVTNYIFGESHDLLFNIDLDLEGKFNISQPINELVKQGALKGNTLIWSTKKYIPVRVGF